MIPALTTAASGPLADLERRVLGASATIEHWFRGQWQEHTPPFYASVDLRNSGFKIAPVDTNLFPGGFNNLSAQFLPLAVQAAQVAIERVCPDARNLLLIPENHTRNRYYLQNVARLRTIFRQAGLNVRIGTLIPEIKSPTELAVPDNPPLVLEPLVRRGGRLGLADFDPCTILLNNDLSAGVPDILKGLHEQYLLPPLHAGWAVRRKSNHFGRYERVANEFAKLLQVDPWLVNPLLARCGEVNFKEKAGEECLAANVAALLELIRAKYLEYGIKEAPYVVVKADAGTYGMGILMAKSPDDVRGLNRDERKKMAVIKEGLEVHEVIIQEGVHTFETVNDAVAEPVVYMVDHYVIGGFYRVHTQRGKDENLNAPGMHFEPLAFDNCCSQPDHFANPDATPNRFYTYGVVARLALLAAAIELEETAPEE
ncbi:MAG TPA: glutamate--cysteine ligase [Burkholderiales bacterium]|nr:glutamate--cysteine ligase [Burkholderiales bacterium]